MGRRDERWFATSMTAWKDVAGRNLELSGERGRSDGSASSARFEAFGAGGGDRDPPRWGGHDRLLRRGRRERPASRSHPRRCFSVGSLTKSMVATVIARLAEAGRLSLDDPVAAHVPELRGSGWAQGATLRDLLANRSGLPLRAGWSSTSPAERTRTTVRSRGSLPMSRAGVPAADVLVVHERGLVPARAGDRDRDGRRRGRTRCGATSPARACARRPSPPAPSRSGAHRGTRSRPRAQCRSSRWSHARTDRPARTAVSTVTDLLRFAAVHLEDPSLAALRARARGRLDLRLAGLLVSRLGPVRLGGWSGLGMGRPHQRRAVGSADRAASIRPPSS